MHDPYMKKYHCFRVAILLPPPPTITHLAVHWVLRPEPVRLQERRVGLWLEFLIARAARRRALDREVPVRQGQFGIDTLQAILEGVAQKRVIRQETKSIVELWLDLDTARGMHALDHD